MALSPQEELELIDLEIALREREAQPKRKPPGGPVAATASGFNKGVLSYVPGLPADTLLNVAELLKAGLGVGYSKLTGRGVPSALEAVSDRSTIPLTSDWFQRQIRRSDVGEQAIDTGAEHHPTLHAGGTAAGASMLGARAAPTRVVGSGYLSGLAAEETRNQTGNNEAAILAALTTPAALGVVTNAAANAPRLLFSPASRQAESALRPYTDQQIQDAIALQARGSRIGLPVAASQALGGGGRVAELEQYALNSPYAPKSALHAVQAQPKQSSAAADALTRMFGPATRSLDRANRIEAAADKSMEWPRSVASKSVQPLYDLLNRTRPQLPESVRWKLAGDLEDLNSKVGLLEQSHAGQAVGDVSRKATMESMIVSKGGVPFRRAEGGVYELDNYLKELRTRIENISKVNPDAKQLVEKAGLQPAASSIRQALIDNSPLLAQAKAQYQQVKNTLDESVRSTSIPDMSRRFNAPDVSTKSAANWQTLEKLLTKQQSPADLRRGESVLSRFDPQAVSDVFKGLMRSKFEASFGKSEVIEPSTAAKFARDMRAIPNLDTAVELTAKAQGVKNPRAAANGFRKVLNLIEVSGLDRGQIGSGTTPQQIEQRSPGRAGASLAFGHGIARAGTLVRQVQYRLNKVEIDQLIQNIDSPRSLENLVKLSQASPGSDTYRKIIMDMTVPQGDVAAGGLYGMMPMLQNPDEP